MDKKTKTKKISHPLEDQLGIEKFSTEKEVTEIEFDELVKYDEYDEKDEEIEKQYQEVFENAMNIHQGLADLLDGSEPKYRARMAEVSLQALNSALNAAEKKSKLKSDKEKLLQKENNSGKTTNNNTVVITREALLEMMEDGEKDQKPPIDADYEDKTDNGNGK
jgi:hypothetical protein